MHHDARVKLLDYGWFINVSGLKVAWDPQGLWVEANRFVLVSLVSTLAGASRPPGLFVYQALAS